VLVAQFWVNLTKCRLRGAAFIDPQCAHDGEHARRLLRVGRIFRPALHVAGVVIDLEEVDYALKLNAAEVVLPVRVVVAREVVERPNRGEESGLVSAGRLSTPWVSSTVPPTKVLRKLSFSTRMRSDWEVREAVFTSVLP
jgi:hypothetical protein